MATMETRIKIPRRYVIVLLTFVCTNVCYIERVGFSIAYTAAADAAGVSQASKGLILSAFFYGYAVSQVPGGWAAQLVGGRRVLLFSFLLWSVVCAVFPLNPARPAILASARLLVGVAQGFIFPSIHTVLSQWVPPHERSRSVSLTMSGMYLGAASGMLALPALVKLRGPQSVFMVEASLGGLWTLLWLRFASDASSTSHALPLSKLKNEGGIPWRRIFLSPAIWAIIVNNFTFHYALYVLMNWLPTYFEQGLEVSLQDMGWSKMLPFFTMFVFSNVGGWIADFLITRRLANITKTRKLLNTTGFVAAAAALAVLPAFRSAGGAVACSSVALGLLALGRAGFAVNHLDVAPRYAGVVMGVSNTAGTMAGIVGVGLTGAILEAAKAAGREIAGAQAWKPVFYVPGWLCLFSAVFFLIYSTGERIFD
ncbi:phosphate transporter 4;6 [Wolffia australiana]